MQQLDISRVWQVTNQEQIAVNQGEKGKTDYKISIKLTWLSLMGLTLSDQKLKQKAKLICIYCQFTICTCHMKWLFFQSFFCWKKYFEELRNNTSKGKNQFWQCRDRPLSRVIRKRTLKKCRYLYHMTQSTLLQTCPIWVTLLHS